MRMAYPMNKTASTVPLPTPEALIPCTLSCLPAPRSYLAMRRAFGSVVAPGFSISSIAVCGCVSPYLLFLSCSEHPLASSSLLKLCPHVQTRVVNESVFCSSLHGLRVGKLLRLKTRHVSFYSFQSTCIYSRFSI